MFDKIVLKENTRGRKNNCFICCDNAMWIFVVDWVFDRYSTSWCV